MQHTQFLTLRIIDVRLSFQLTPIKFDLLCVRDVAAAAADTTEGHNVPMTTAISVTGYRHSFYMLADACIDSAYLLSSSSSSPLSYNNAWNRFFFENNITGTTSVEYTHRMSMFHYGTEEQPMWKFTTDYRDIRNMVRCLQDQFYGRQFYDVFLDDTSLSTQLLLKNFITVRVVCGSEDDIDQCDHFTIQIDDIIPMLPDEENSIDVSKFPYRVLAIDIECLSHADGSFPNAATPECEIILIGCSMRDCGGMGSSSSSGSSDTTKKNTLKTIFATCDAGVTTLDDNSIQVFYVDTEAAMLLKFIEFVKEYRPNVIIGYNVKDFDMGYIYDRLQFRQILSCTAQCTMDGRPWSSKKSIYQSNQMGARECRNFTVFGFIIVDLFEFVLNNYKLDSYKLNAVARKFTGEEKLDMPYEYISVYYHVQTLQNGNSYSGIVSLTRICVFNYSRN